MDGGGTKLNTAINQTAAPAECKAILKDLCVPKPTSWSKLQM